MLYSAFPEPQGLYDPDNESDSCGVAMITDIQGRRSHAIVADGLTALEHLEHRGAAGAEPNSGDGAGILIQLPVELLREVVDFELPPPSADGANPFAAGICFLPQDPAARAVARAHIEAIADEEGLTVLGWRELPTDPHGAEVGETALRCMPHMEQLFVASPQHLGGVELDRCVYPLRKRAERNGVYFPSLSSRTMVYKGMLTTMQLPQYFPDLRDERCRSAIAIVHSRFSTNTFPSWPLAHPFRFVAHNGEINTVRGNRNRMHAREAMLASAKIPGDLSRLSPICTPEASDSASFDEVLELLHLGGRSLPHAVLMMIPEAWENNATMDPSERAFWQFHASLMEPWDGPACVTFTDGTLVGAVLDRNGLRPGRWWRTLDDRIILASESGVLDVPSAQIVAKGRLQPGKMFLIDTAAGRIVGDDEVKESLAGQRPYGEWLHSGLLDIKTLPDRVRVQPNHESVVRRQIAFGYTEEDLRVLLTPMAASGAEPLGSMGTDTPTAVLSQRSRLLYDYFVELFAQVTNPPLDAIREEIVTSMARVMGPEQNLLEPTAASCRQIVLRWPVLDNDELSKIVHINDDGEHGGLRTAVLKALYDVERGGEGLADALEDLRLRACDAIAKGARTLVISDRDSDHTRAPIPSLLAVSAVHHHLVRTKERTTVALVVESGDAREVHHIAMLIGFGAAAVNPYLAFESIEDLVREGELTGIEPAAAVRNYLRALGKGVTKVMSKMGISTVASYTAAQAFEAVGIDKHVIDEYFTGTRKSTRRRRPGCVGRGGEGQASAGIPGEPDGAGAPAPGGRWRIRVPPRGRTAPVHPRSGFSVAAFDPHGPPRHLQAVLRRGEPPLRRRWHPARTVRLQETKVACPAGGSRACRIDCHAVQHRRNELRLHLRRGPRDHGDRHEQPRWPVELGRGGRGHRPAVRPETSQRRQTGRLRPLRRHQRLPGECHRYSDQDGSGRQTR